MEGIAVEVEVLSGMLVALDLHLGTALTCKSKKIKTMD